MESQFPNNMYGHGRINIQKAYELLLKLLKKRNKRRKEHDVQSKNEKGKDKKKSEVNSRSKKKELKNDDIVKEDYQDKPIVTKTQEADNKDISGENN